MARCNWYIYGIFYLFYNIANSYYNLELMVKRKLLQIAVDGVAGSGKTTIAKKLADYYGFYHFSTGNIFRSFALVLHNETNLTPKNVKKKIRKVSIKIIKNKIILNGKNVSNLLFDPKISKIASLISGQKYVRKKYRKIIKKISKQEKIILDGRDIGTVVLPRAKYKFFFLASPEIRAKRRLAQLKLSLSHLKKITVAIKERDAEDTKRSISPLKPAKDAIVIDTTKLTITKIFNKIVKHMNEYKSK